MRPLIVIPSRMGSVRLPHKPLAMVQEPMVVHVWRQACEANFAPVVVACDHPDIARVIQDAGGQAVLTHSQHATGSDRVAEAIDLIDPKGEHDLIINLQGDMVLFPSAILSRIIEPFEHAEVDMTTFIQPSAYGTPSSVRVRVEEVPPASWVRCRDFSRKGYNAAHVHLGVYGFRRQALRRFTQLSQTEHELSESLEQLRALDHHFFIAAVVLDDEKFLSVDTPEDLSNARAYIVRKS